jgi:hypothetical protein
MPVCFECAKSTEPPAQRATEVAPPRCGCEESKPLLRSTSGTAPTAAPATVREVVRSAGESLHPGLRANAESRFGRDFTRVRVHTDARAASSAAAASANAYAVGDHIVFAAGKYRPTAVDGVRLIAHELAHVIQSRNGGTSATAEERAERAAELVSRGDRVDAAALGGPSGGLDRQDSQEQPHHRHAGTQQHRRQTGIPCHAGVRACVSLSHHKAWLLDRHDHVVRGPVSAMGGRTGAPTPVGSFSVTRHDRYHFSREYHAPMPYAVFFHGGSAFHQGSPSTPSHGCVHLAEPDAAAFFTHLHDGDPVQITP